jgi:DNA-binding PadR family transcriptional regulator
MSDGYSLSDYEGTLLGLIVRAEPITAYKILRAYELSPVTNYNNSKGTVYPIIRRLKQRGLVVSSPVVDDGRGTEQLGSTEAGRAAVRLWARDIPSQLLAEDPLRTRVQSFDLLSRMERIEWCAKAKAALADKLDELGAYGESVDVPFKDLVHDGAVSSIRARMDWLDRVLRVVVQEEAA